MKFCFIKFRVINFRIFTVCFIGGGDSNFQEYEDI